MRLKTKRARKPKPVEPTFTTWAGCYDDSWKGFIVDEAFAHPAKYARRLVGRIFDYLFAREFITHGDLCADPFGGIGTGGIIAASRGVRWVGCELEEKFVALAKRNFELHRRVWESAGDPFPVIVQGDSRKLRSVLAAADVMVSSPPFQGSTNGTDAEFMERMEAEQNPGPRKIGRRTAPEDYGQSPGQLGSMTPGTVDAVLSSPPYAECIESKNGPSGLHVGKESMGRSLHAMNDAGYGRTDGQLGAMPAGDVAAVVSSPPWENQEPIHAQGSKFRIPHDSTGLSTSCEYGQSDGQIGNSTGETFWAAARDIVAECHAILRPGGVAVWVVKGFVRNKKLVDFPHDWQRLCEACGFVLVEEIHASLVKESRNADLFGGVKVDRTERKSFFRRLCEKKGSPPIDWETVLVMRKGEMKKAYTCGTCGMGFEDYESNRTKTSSGKSYCSADCRIAGTIKPATIKTESQCIECEQTKAAAEFYNDSHNKKNGCLSYQCRECIKQIRRDHYDENREEIIERVREYAKSHPEVAKKHGAKQRAAVTKEERKAWRMVNAAVKKGTLAKPGRCEGCERAAHLHAHHYKGYDHPMEVVWLCVPCHHAAHERGPVFRGKPLENGGGSVGCVVTSPPFAEAQSGGGIAAHNGMNGNVKTGTNCGYQNQGGTNGNLAAMKPGSVDDAIKITEANE